MADTLDRLNTLDTLDTLDTLEIPRLRIHVLASGSKGNCSIVEDVNSGRMLMVDCGICRRDILSRCNDLGIDPSRVEAVLVTHEHTDHTKGFGPMLRWLRKFGQEPTIYATPGTARESSELQKVAEENFEITPLTLGCAFEASGIDVIPFPTSHDVAEPCGFRLAAGNDALGYMTDTGIVTPQAREALAKCRVLAIEANHDVKILKEGPYPTWLKARIALQRGHLSNDQARELAAALSWDGLEQVIAMHASETNNEYPLALEAVTAGVADAGFAVITHVARQSSAISIG